MPPGSLLGPLLFNILINGLNFVSRTTSLRLYADDTTDYALHKNPIILERNVNQDLVVLHRWFNQNFLEINPSKSQAMIIGKSKYNYKFTVGTDTTEICNKLKIHVVNLDNDLNFKLRIHAMVKKAYTKIGAIRKLINFIKADIAVRPYKAYVLPHLEYCSPKLIGIGKSQSKKLEAVNYYAIKTLLNIPRSTDNETALNQIKFTPRTVNYNLRSSRLKVNQPAYSTKYLHNSFNYIVFHFWNNLWT